MRHAVLIAGGGPTGLMLAGELALAGVNVAIVERRTTEDLPGRNAGGLHARTIEVLDQRGIADRFIAQGTKYPVAHFFLPLDLSDFPSRHNYVLALPQRLTERTLVEWVDELHVTWYRGREVTDFSQDDSGVDVTLDDGAVIRTEYLVGCDGGRSIVRKTAGIDFPGSPATMSWILAEVQFAEEPKWGFHEDALGRHAIGKGEDGFAGVALIERQVRTGAEPTLRDVSDALIAAYGTDFGVHSPRLISYFTDMTRQAAAYRDRRVLLAGDAAHVHPPMGGQGLNIGVQDAVNLGWKLAQVVRGTAADALLDTYHAERQPVGASVLRNTMAQVALGRTDDRSKALAGLMAGMLKMDEPRRMLAAEISGLGVHYDLGSGHPLHGRRMPDLELRIGGGRSASGEHQIATIYSLLHTARPLLINFGSAIDLAGWEERVRVIDAEYAGAWELPMIDEVAAPIAVLVRPDGYVAWVGNGTNTGLVDALTMWFGPPATT